MITIVDYGMGNIGSVANILKKLRVPAQISGDPDVVATAERLVLPGVGHFAAGMKALEDRGLRPALERAVVERGAPILGICLGMQLMTRHSEEGDVAGLGWIDGHVVRFDPFRLGAGMPIPHMGWNFVTPAKNSASVEGFDESTRFYFVHSYHVVCDRPDDVLVWAHYGHRLVAGFEVDNICGVQFHPEKSHQFGMAFLRQRYGGPAGA